MTLTIDLPPELESALRQHAAKSGKDVTDVVLEAVREKISKLRTFDEVCAPIAEAVKAAGMTDEEVGRFFEEVRDEVRREKHGRPQ
ncbi:MAG: ribbon-helix-helix protein, CopG family [Planctomycetia bacterium]|nr:ribbon-helix-helix protein, CopG family [Planctomycetia bacterium]